MKPIYSLLGLWLAASLSHFAYADSGPSMGAIPAVVSEECASCHMVYPPAMLPVASWQRLMAGLDKHFGVDASLDAKTTKEVGNWFVTHGGTYKRVAANDRPEQDRISKSAWFVRKHREVAAATWNRPSIKSASNCTACHGQGATKGVFEEDLVKIPK